MALLIYTSGKIIKRPKKAKCADKLAKWHKNDAIRCKTTPYVTIVLISEPEWPKNDVVRCDTTPSLAIKSNKQTNHPRMMPSDAITLEVSTNASS